MLSMAEMARLVEWVGKNKTIVPDMSRTNVARKIHSEIKLKVSQDAVKAAEEAVGITRNRGNAGSSGRKNHSQIIARAVVDLYAQFDVKPPIDLVDISKGN